MDSGTSFSGEKYAATIVKLQEEFDHRFADFKTHRATFHICADPFTFDVEDAPPGLQMELIDLQCKFCPQNQVQGGEWKYREAWTIF